MNFKTTYILFGILGIVLIVFAFALWMGPTTAGESKWVLPSTHDPANPVDAKEIDTVVIERSQPKSEKMVFVKDGDHWKMTEPHSFRVDRFLVDQVVRQVLDAQREEKADLTSDLKQWGLDSPTTTVTLKKDDEKEWKVNFGSESRGGSSAVVYVNSSERPKEPMAVRRSSLDTVFKEVNDFRAKDLLAESGFDIDAVDVKNAKNEVALKKVEQGTWRFTQPPFGEADYQGESPAFGGADAKPSPSVSSLLQALSGIKVASTEDFVANDASDSDLAKYGLEAGKPALMRIQVTRTVGEKKTPVTDALLVGKEDEVKKTTKKPDGKDETTTTKFYYARLESEKNVVRIDPKGLELVTKLLDDPAAFRDRDLVHLDTFRVDALDAKNASVADLELRKNKQNEWMLRLGDSGKGQRADHESIQKLIDGLAVKRQIKEFPDAKSKESDLGLDKPVAVLSVWEGGVKAEEKKEEKKDGDAKDDKKKDEKKDEKKEPEFPALKSDVRDKPKVKLSFGAKDVNKGIVYVKRQAGDETILAAVPDTLLELVSHGPLAYRDRTLPHMAATPDEVNKVVLTRPDGTYELEKETKDKKAAWKFKLPKELAGRTANAFNVSEVVNVLSHLNAQRLETEKASEADLDPKYGLKSPQIKVTLTATTSDKKTEEKTYLFGKETADGVFAKQGDQDLIFVAGKFLLSTLNNPLQDPTVFTFDANKVKSMKLIGWQDVVGSPVTLELERESAVKWTPKAPKDFNLDPTKAESFLASIANLRADSFVATKDAPKPEVFELKAGALEVEVNVDKEEPYKLTIGALDADKKNYYAKSNKLPNQFFLLAKDRFENAKSKPAYFSK